MHAYMNLSGIQRVNTLTACKYVNTTVVDGIEDAEVDGTHKLVVGWTGAKIAGQNT